MDNLKNLYKFETFQSYIENLKDENLTVEEVEKITSFSLSLVNSSISEKVSSINLSFSYFSIISTSFGKVWKDEKTI